MYFSLNLGARNRYKESAGDIVYRNPVDSPVDFNATKYVIPFKKTNNKQL
jgi:hypothetical protein